MVRQYANFIAKFRYFIVAVWLIVVTLSVALLPNLTTVVNHKSMNFLPSSSNVVAAKNLLNEINPKTAAKSVAVIAIHNPHGLRPEDKNYLKNKLNQIDENKSQYHVQSVQDEFNTDKSAASAFVSKDGTTEIGIVGFDSNDIDEATSISLNQIHKVFLHVPSTSSIYFTGDAPIQQDDASISKQGTEKTAGVTIALVFIILLIVFRSVIAPFVTLISIGLSFMFSSSLVAYLSQFGLPVSTFTQTFLIAILFGAGTDYSIILMNRFREEMSKGQSKTEALAASLGAIGKTVVFSSLTVLISFAALAFANFGLYQSAVGVAVGMLVILIACLTFIPSLIHILGDKLFWPQKPAVGVSHRQSRIWQATARLSISHPWWTVFIMVIALLPVALLFTNERTFDPMTDIPNAPSVKGFTTISDSFGAGYAMPSSVVLKTNENLRTPEGLATIENISRAVASLNEVKEVDSATRPIGKVVDSFELATQNQLAANGLDKIHSGIANLSQNLNHAGIQIASGQEGVSQLFGGSQQVTIGTQNLQQGLNHVSSNTSKLAEGALQVSTGANELQSSLNTYAESAAKVGQGASQVSNGLNQSAESANQLSSGASKLSTSEQQLALVAENLSDAIAQYAKDNPSASENPQWQQVLQLTQANEQGATQSATASKQLATGLSQMSASMPGLVHGAQSVTQGTNQLVQGATELANGSGNIARGASQVATGTNQLTNGIGQLSSGAFQLTNGSHRVTNGIQSMSESIGQLSSGLLQAGHGANQLNSALGDATSYLKQSQNATTQGEPGFYIPESAIASNKDLKKVMDVYISPDGHIAQVKVILNLNPYSSEAINDVPAITQAAQAALNASPLHTGAIMLAGATATQSELNQISNQDFSRTMLIILFTIFVLLILLLRSILAPLYIIVSLTGTYFVTMGLIQVVSLHVLHKPGISWPVPFFIFLLLVALGVDYAIFLMSRFDEEHAKGMSNKDAMRKAMGHMGGVIFSAAIIMAGTFGSMMVAGVTSLVEIGIAIIIGLFIYTTIVLGFFVPACTAIIGEGHKWPFALNTKSGEIRLNDSISPRIQINE